MASAHEYRSTASDTRVAGRAVEAEVPRGEGQPRAAGAEMAAGEDGENARHRPPDRSRSRAAAAAAVAVAVAPRGRTRPVMAGGGGGDEGKGRGGGRGEKREGEGTGRTQVGLGWVGLGWVGLGTGTSEGVRMECGGAAWARAANVRRGMPAQAESEGRWGHDGQ